MIQRERVKNLNDKNVRPREYVLYWMQASQRSEYNHALEYAIRQANELGQPLLVFFGLTDNFPGANERHYAFMLEGLRETKQSLEKRGIRLVVRRGSPPEDVVKMAENASVVVVDRGYLRVQRAWRREAAQEMTCRFVEVESDAVVPVEEASTKEEYAAATLRPKIHRKLKHFLEPLPKGELHFPSPARTLDSWEIDDAEKTLARLHLDRSLSRVSSFRGGTSEALRHLDSFLAGKLDHFARLRNDPTADVLSNLSPYLHFGQISPLFIALKVLETNSPGRAAFLEELIVRRELSLNFVYFHENYDTFDCLPAWAKKTLRDHQRDPRPYLYSPKSLENAATHDSYWNAAQSQLVWEGKMHGYMRMYWGKKILEWSETPEEAFRLALYLNNKYALDGGDPNSFAGVAWCFGKHDRPWGERAVFGKVRYMNDRGLKRKFPADEYVKMVFDRKPKR